VGALGDRVSLRRIEYLDGLRGVAIAMVVLYHAFKQSNSTLVNYGAMGVDLFFMISGFVILLTLEKCRDFPAFFKRRWLRLYPAMLIACVVTFLLFFVTMTWPPGANVLPGLTLIDDRWYSWALNANVKSLDGAYWTLYLEMRFYVIFGLAYFLLGPRQAILVLIAMSLFYLIVLSFGYGLGVLRFTDFRFEAWFAAGALFYLWTKEQREALFVSALATGLLAAWIYFPSHGPRLFGLALVMLFSAGVRWPVVQSILSVRSLTWLGAISYPLYLVHSHIIEAAGLVGIPVSLALAHLIAKYAEPWAKDIIKAWPVLRPA
jgi:peptidoglycan/LPS O-acetylase OafA/YrhL